MTDRFNVTPVGTIEWGIIENEHPFTVIFYHGNKELIESLCMALNKWEESRELAHRSREWEYWFLEVRDMYFNHMD